MAIDRMPFGMLRPIHRGMLRFVAFDVVTPQVVYAPVRQTQETRKQNAQPMRNGWDLSLMCNR